MSLMNTIMAGASEGSSSTVVEPEGVEFDGVTDYLSRSTDLVGNVDSKTFTFSCWVYRSFTSGEGWLALNNGYYGLSISISGSGMLLIEGTNTSNSDVLYTDINSIIPLQTWTHILISVDLSNTSNRSVYINDRLMSNTWSTYLNQNIDFTSYSHNIGSMDSSGTSTFKGRLSHLYLDYQYRNLSIEANRRIFIDSNGNPA